MPPLRTEVRRFTWRALMTPIGPILVSWLVSEPVGLFLRHVMQSPAWLTLTATIAVYLITYRSLPDEDEAEAELARLEQEREGRS